MTEVDKWLERAAGTANILDMLSNIVIVGSIAFVVLLAITVGIVWVCDKVSFALHVSRDYIRGLFVNNG